MCVCVHVCNKCVCCMRYVLTQQYHHKFNTQCSTHESAVDILTDQLELLLTTTKHTVSKCTQLPADLTFLMIEMASEDRKRG